jgi:hypothetical protein
MAQESAPRPRDLRLDFFRGVGMFIILIAHITDNPWTLWIPARFGFSDATEMFVFCSGMASAIAFGAVFSRAGWALGTLRILYRIWQVYWVHLGVFFATLALLLWIDTLGPFPRGEVGRLNLLPFLNHPGPALTGLFTLTYVPNYFDILPMYLVILGMIPVMMALARVDARLALAASAGLWLVTTLTGFGLPAEAWFANGSTREWFFNPFGWQLVFFTGFAFMAGWLPAPPVRRWLVLVAVAVVVLSVPLAWYRVIGVLPAVREWRQDWAVLFDKTHFGVLRYLHFLALAYLAWVAVGPGGARLAAVPALAPVVGLVVRVGQQSLAVFAASMVMARALGAVLGSLGGGWAAALAVNLAGMAAIVAVALVAGYVKRQPWQTARAARPVPRGGAMPVAGLPQAAPR